MQPPHSQAASAVVMIRPHHFYPNHQTRKDNNFQSVPEHLSRHQLSELAYTQVTLMANKLQSLGVQVYLFEDCSEQTPDSVFPNNWFSTHADNRIVTYPMFANNRRKERRADVIEKLIEQFKVTEVIDYSVLEKQDIYLEGTGAMVLDHTDKTAYVVRSHRANSTALEQFCERFNYQSILFDAIDKQGTAVYHTNVLMCIATQFAMYCPHMIKDNQQRAMIEQRLIASGKQIIVLSESQIAKFCGNALELQTEQGKILALSKTAFNALTTEQIRVLEKSVKLVPFDVSAIETAGGSVRCMLASIHLDTI
jgi:hypothetical protein